MRSRTLSKSEIRDINQLLFQEYGFEPFSKKELVTEVEGDVATFIHIRGEPAFFYVDKLLIPTLKYVLQNKPFLKEIVVDMGAVKFVASGADVMRPGIVNIAEDIVERELVVVVDEEHKKPLAVCRALQDAQALQVQTSGKSAENIHWVGDKIWKHGQD